jgi:glycosyltransferase involved in cell wall biosynthesis
MSRPLAIVPARNEAARIEETVRALIAAGLDVLVVDDASTDGTAALAEKAGARTISLPERRGKGGALSAGIAAADAPILALIDADLGPTASIAGPLVAHVAAGHADLAIAAPPRQGKSGFGLVEGAARQGIRLLARTRMDRPLSGQRAAKAEVLRAVRFAPGFGVEVAMTVDAVRLGYRVQEIPLTFTHARTGRDLAGFRHRFRQGRHVVRALVSCAVRPRKRSKEGRAWLHAP